MRYPSLKIRGKTTLRSALPLNLKAPCSMSASSGLDSEAPAHLQLNTYPCWDTGLLQALKAWGLVFLQHFLKSPFSHFWKDSTLLRSSTHLNSILILNTSQKRSRYTLLRLAHKQQEIKVPKLDSNKITLGHPNLFPLFSTVLQGGVCVCVFIYYFNIYKLLN